MSEHLLIERDGGLLTLRMHRPDKKNALTRAMYAGMAETLDQRSATQACVWYC